ncbi:PIR protein, putative [Plasmodium sp. gorilla clade G1]|nr:PIR protein, putative [Plasmodium sp. gorilla clade G1]
MNVRYINILLFALPLNILVSSPHKKPCITPRHTQINRSLCECELYAPTNYDNDQQMKEVKENFNKQTQQRFEEYDKRMKTTRQKCREQCDKEIQKIILKDKLEKQMEEQLTTLETKINTDDIPTCICEKSIADKMEKGCLRCGGVFGGIAPSVGLLGGIGEAAISVLKPLAIEAAKKAAVTEAIALATQEGMKAVISEMNELFDYFSTTIEFVDLKPIVTSSTYNNGAILHKSAIKLANTSCDFEGTAKSTSFCNTILNGETTNFVRYAKAGTTAYDATLSSQTPALTEAKVGAVNATYGGYHVSIIASIVAIVVIVLIMVIIYLILRYRRKKKTKKKLQYIKLLEE